MEEHEIVPHEEATEAQDIVLPVQEEAQAAPPSRANELNIRELRLKAARLEQERNEYYQKLQEQQKTTTPELSLNPDDLVEWKHVQKEIDKVRDELNSYKQHYSQQSAESRLRTQYPDFEAVVTPDTIETLRDQYPEIAASINANPDLYTKGSAVYTIIKKLNIAATHEQHAKVEQNLQKPRPSTTVNPQHGDSPLSKANAFAQGLTPELRNQLFKEMQEAKKRA